MKDSSEKLTVGGLVVALGIIYGDIGTSPLYVLKAIVGTEPISRSVALGGFSCVFWTLTLLTTFKYVLLTLQADNKGEGGIFALYALVRRRAPWLVVPAIIGGSTLLADGIITPPISVSSAVEGLRIFSSDIPTVPIVIVILVLLFAAQQFGTRAVGTSFGPIMFLWFSTLALLGLSSILSAPSVLEAINPYFAYHLLFEHPGGFWLLGAVFLCTTGAEALYADLGHCGRRNIRASWIFVKLALLLNYAGQSAWLLVHQGELLSGRNPFYEMMPEWFLMPGIVLATSATIIASQALISGSFTVVTEAMRLYTFPKIKVVYPTELKGQIYVPGINWLLLVGCVGVMLYFQESSNMEAAYGLAINLNMIVTTILLSYFLYLGRIPVPLVALFVTVYLSLEGLFLVANLDKFEHGGWVTILIGGVIASIMWIWYRGSMIKRRYTEYVSITSYLPMIKQLAADTTVPKYSTHLVFMTGADVETKIESKIVYSIFRKRPKRADIYWFIHVDVLDEPYTMEYRVEKLIPGIAYRIEFRLGFRIEPRVNLLFRRVIEELAESNEVDIISRYDSLRRNGIPGDFRFVVLEKFLSYENALPPYEQLMMDGYYLIRRFSLSEEKSFGLDTSSVTSEKVPMVISPIKSFEMKRVA